MGKKKGGAASATDADGQKKRRRQGQEPTADEIARARSLEEQLVQTFTFFFSPASSGC